MKDSEYDHVNVAFLILDDKSEKNDHYIKKLIRPKGNEFANKDLE